MIVASAYAAAQAVVVITSNVITIVVVGSALVHIYIYISNIYMG